MHDRTIMLSVDGKINYTPITVKQKDTLNRLKIIPVSNSEPYKLTNVATARIKLLKPDGKQIDNEITIDKQNNCLYATLTEQMLLIPSSKVECEIVLNETEGRLTTGTFYLEIRSQVHDSSTVESKAEYKTFENAIQKLSTYESRLAQKANEVDLITTNIELRKKVDKSAVTNVILPKGNLSYAELPVTGNTIGWYYYCPDGDGINGAGNYAWDGESWYFSGTGDQGYSVIKEDLSHLEKDQYDFEILSIDSTSSGWRLKDSDGLVAADANYKILKYVVKPGLKYEIVGCDKFQFQSVASVPSSGANNRIGITYLADGAVVAPLGANYLIVSTLVNKTVYVSAANPKIKEVSKVVEGVQNYFPTGFIEIPLVMIDDMLLSGSNGSLVSYPTSSHLYSVSEPVDVVGQSRLLISACSNYANALYCFYDINGNVITPIARANADKTEIVDLSVNVPTNAKTLRVARFDTRASVKKNDMFVDTNKIISRLWTGKRWVCIGDSLTEKNARSTKHYHDYVSESTGITVVNMGLSGSGYKKRFEESKAFYQRIANMPSDVEVVTIFGSFNDSAYFSSLGNITDTTNDTLLGCVNLAINAVYAINPIVPLGIIAPTPWGVISDTNGYGLYVDGLKRLCAYRGILFLDLYHESGLRPWDTTFKQMAYSKDDGNGTHPDETGHALIAPKFKTFLETLIRID